MSKNKRVEIAAIIISIIALAISIISSIDVHQQVKLTSGQVQSYVQVVEAELVEPITEASYIKLQLKLKNYGQTAAINVYGEMDYQVGVPDMSGKGNSATRLSFGSMGPGMERTVVLTSNRINRREWPTPFPKNYESVYFFGTIWYIDNTTQEEKKEDWCYELPLKQEKDLSKLNLELSGILKYSSKVKK